MTEALAIRVLDLTTGIGGPIAGMWLGDFGADVVKVEAPGGDPGRAKAGFAVWNRNKRSVVVDASDGPGVEWLAAMIEGADVLLVSSREDLEPYGFDVHSLLAQNRRLVVAEFPSYLPGYAPWSGGHESPELLAAIGGQAWRQNSVTGDPVDLVTPVVAYVHGVWGAQCIIAALVERERSNAGQLVTVDGMRAMNIVNLQQLTVDPDLDDLDTAVGPAGRHPTYTRLLAGDGKWFTAGALGPKSMVDFLELISLSHLIDDPRMGGDVWNMIRPHNFPWMQEKIAEAALQHPREYWLKALDDLGIPSGPLDDRDEWLDHPQIRSIGMRLDLEDPTYGSVTMPGVALRMTRTPGHVRAAGPRLGEHTGTVASWPKQPEGEVLPPVRPGPLSGFTVLNIGSWLAVPFGGSLLADLGARVIKVEPLTGDPSSVALGYPPTYGMESLALNLAIPEGQAVFHKLVANADAFMDGLRPGITTKLHIDYASLRAVNPEIVTVTISGYGETGELARLPGFDMILQAMSGMMQAQGGHHEPVVQTVAVCDIATAAISALGVTLGLYHKLRTGEGQRISGALAATAAYLQSGELVRYGGRPASTIGGTDFKGPGPFDRMYEVSDGWIRVQMSSEQDGAVLTGEALNIDAEEVRASPEAVIAGRLRDLTAQEALSALNAAGVPTVPVRKISAVMRDPRLLAGECFYFLPQDVAGKYVAGLGNSALFTRTTRFGPQLAPGLGEHTTQALRTAGYDDDEIHELQTAGLVYQGGRRPLVLAPAYR